MLFYNGETSMHDQLINGGKHASVLKLISGNDIQPILKVFLLRFMVTHNTA